MELKKIIEEGAAKMGSQKALAIALGLNPQILTDAKAGKKGIPAVACGKLAEILGMDRWEVVAASELVTEKDEMKRAYLAPFVRRAAAFAGIAVMANVITFVSPAPAEAAQALEAQKTRFILC